MANPKLIPEKFGRWSEHQAVKMVRGEMGLKNVDMIPFVRTLEIAKDVNEVLASRRTSWFQCLKAGQMPRGSQETTILRIWWLNLDRLNFIQLLYDYNSLFVDLIHFSTTWDLCKAFLRRRTVFTMDIIPIIFILYIYYILSKGSLEVKLPTIWTDEKQSWAEAGRREE